MSDLHDPHRDRYPVIGLSLSERDRDFWDDLSSRSTLRRKTADPGLFPLDAEAQCLNLLPGRSTCSRADDHSGRHIALLGESADRPRYACSAWPGTHRPTPADLEE